MNADAEVFNKILAIDPAIHKKAQYQLWLEFIPRIQDWFNTQILMKFSTLTEKSRKIGQNQ
jgi:hypothetical protein